MNLFGPGRDFFCGTAVNYVYVLGPHAFSASGRVHSHVSSAYHRDISCALYRRIILRQISFHEIYSGEVLVGRTHAQKIFSRNIHERRQTCAGADEHRLKALFLHQFIHSYGSADYGVRNEFDAFCLESGDFSGHDLLWKAELRYAIYQNASCLMKTLKYSHVIAFVHQVSRAGKAGRASPYYGYLMSVALGRFDLLIAVIGGMPVGYKPLETSYGYRCSLFTVNALSLALSLLRTYASADGRKRTGLADHLICLFEFAFGHFSYKIRYLYHHGASGHARLFSALETSHGFVYGHLFSISHGHFQEVFVSYIRGLFRHRIFFSH